MTWPEALTTSVTYVCWTFITWRVGAFCARMYAEANNWDQRSK